MKKTVIKALISEIFGFIAIFLFWYISVVIMFEEGDSINELVAGIFMYLITALFIVYIIVDFVAFQKHAQKRVYVNDVVQILYFIFVFGYAYYSFSIRTRFPMSEFINYVVPHFFLLLCKVFQIVFRNIYVSRKKALSQTAKGDTPGNNKKTE